MNFSEHLKINDEGEALTLTLCDNPFECFTCKDFFNNISQALLKEWMNKNKIEDLLQLSTFKFVINENNFELLSIDGLNKWLGEIMPFFEQYAGEQWPTASLLLRANLALSPNNKQIILYITIIYPESVGKTAQGRLTLFHHDDCISVTHQTINAKTFYNQNAIDNIFDSNCYDEIFKTLWSKLPYLNEVNKLSSIYLFSWSLFKLKLIKTNGYYCNDWYLNNDLQNLNIKANDEK